MLTQSIGVYKATPIRALEAETDVPPIPLYLKHLRISTIQIAHKWAVKIHNQSLLKIKIGRKIKPTATPRQLKSEWEESLMGKPVVAPSIRQSFCGLI